MSVDITKVIGYVIDVEPEWRKLHNELTSSNWDSINDRWLGDFSKSEQAMNDYESLDFIAYYNRSKFNDTEGKITLIDDGMSGTYTKLVYPKLIVEYADEEDEEVVRTLNEFLNKSEVPKEIFKKLYKVYKEIFGEPERPIEVKAQYFIHYN